MPRRSKRYQESRQLFDRVRVYPIDEALDIIKKMPSPKFDETLELHIKMGIDPSKSDQLVRGTISLPHGTGRDVRVVVFAAGEKAEEAKEAGADFVGAADLVEKVEKGWTDFDIAIATPDMMRDIGKLGRVLGPRGLMPSPKSGTVTTDVGEAVKAFKAGRVEFKNDKTGNVHVPIGKKSFSESQLKENLESALSQIFKMKPASSKGRFFQRVFVSSTMNPGIRVDHSEITT
ncbi:MAG TPA: 50S ribosomal protein L1 [Kosmotogaceae bacterium]|nr:MAG: 50S ribosomal protein L1 [Thermotogales bacterium 46_20]HAA85077.1 50S ribosomal protein L1 [Kosmotogaceae bacterium]